MMMMIPNYIKIPVELIGAFWILLFLAGFIGLVITAIQLIKAKHGE